MKTLLPFRNKEGKFFTFDHFESYESNLRIKCYNQCAEQNYPFILNDQIIEITKITIKQNTFTNMTSLQGSLTPDYFIFPESCIFHS